MADAPPAATALRLEPIEDPAAHAPNASLLPKTNAKKGTIGDSLHSSECVRR